MSEPITIPIPPHNQARFAQLEAEFAQLRLRQNEAIATLIATQVDPATVATWAIERRETEIVCTPPAEPPPTP